MDDMERDNYLKQQGFKVLRFDAIDIKDNLDAVKQEIIESFDISD